MKFKVEEEYRCISRDIVINPVNNEIGLLHQYIDVEGHYRENIGATFQINAQTNTQQGWKPRFEELFDENTQTGTIEEPYPIGSSWNDLSGLSFFTIQAIIQVYGEKLYVISDGGHHAGLFSVHANRMDEFIKNSGYHERELQEEDVD